MPRFFDASEEAGFAEFLDRLPGPYLVMTDDADGSLLACGGWARGRAPAAAVLCWGIVRADRHGTGVGRRLLQARLEGIAAIGGFRTVEAATSQHTEAFFAHFGFVSAAVEVDGFAPGIHRVDMVLTLGEAPVEAAPEAPEPAPGRTVVLETARLFLREATAADARFLLGLLNEPAWLEHIGDRNVHTLEAAREYIATRFVTSYRANGFGFYVMELKADGAPIGLCGLAKRDFLADVDIGYAVRAPWWGQGYALEATRAVLEWARGGLKLPRVVAIVSSGNTRSTRLLEKIGLRFERQIKHPPDDSPVDLYS